MKKTFYLKRSPDRTYWDVLQTPKTDIDYALHSVSGARFIKLIHEVARKNKKIIPLVKLEASVRPFRGATKLVVWNGYDTRYQIAGEDCDLDDTFFACVSGVTRAFGIQSAPKAIYFKLSQLEKGE